MSYANVQVLMQYWCFCFTNFNCSSIRCHTLGEVQHLYGQVAPANASRLYRIKQLPKLVAILNGDHSSKRVMLIVNFHDWLGCVRYLFCFTSVHLGRGCGPEDQEVRRLEDIRGTGVRHNSEHK